MAVARRSVLLSFLCLACSGVSLWSAPAQACGLTPCAALEDVVPFNHARDVPINTQIRVGYSGLALGMLPMGGACSSELKRIRLVPDEGSPIDLEASAEFDTRHAVMTAQPSEPLRSDTHYVVQVQLLDTDDCRCATDVRWRGVSDFTTGSSIDVEPPAFAGLTSIETSTPHTAMSNCGGGFGFLATLHFSPPPEPARGLRYQLRANDKPVLLDWVNPTHGVGVSCSPSQLAIGPGTKLELRAIDSAGNVSAPHEPIEIPHTSCQLPVDAGASPMAAAGASSLPSPPAPDASAEDLDASAAAAAPDASTDSAPRHRAYGCSTAPGSPASEPAAWLLLLVALALVRRLPE